MIHNMEWNVFIYDINHRKIVPYNIFNNAKFKEYCIKAYKESKNDEPALKEKIESELKYYYWSRCEWEVLISGFPDNDNAKKVDVYGQVALNIDRFIKYVIEYCEKQEG